VRTTWTLGPEAFLSPPEGGGPPAAGRGGGGAAPSAIDGGGGGGGGPPGPVENPGRIEPPIPSSSAISFFSFSNFCLYTSNSLTAALAKSIQASLSDLVVVVVVVVVCLLL